MATEIKVPALGESVTEGTIAEWLKQPGEAVAADEAICSLETDKVAVDVPSPVAGIMSEHRVAVGDTVEVGAVIAVIEEGASAATAAPAVAAKADTPA
ncbi:MAG TPA: biotin/lipoyl-containing protein, partial [Erythrobacter sp.]|nr:biotin/lipoyl-containing protein [Erythrobacter sp.]